MRARARAALARGALALVFKSYAAQVFLAQPAGVEPHHTIGAAMYCARSLFAHGHPHLYKKKKFCRRSAREMARDFQIFAFITDGHFRALYSACRSENN